GNGSPTSVDSRGGGTHNGVRQGRSNQEVPAAPGGPRQRARPGRAADEPDQRADGAPPQAPQGSSQPTRPAQDGGSSASAARVPEASGSRAVPLPDRGPGAPALMPGLMPREYSAQGRRAVCRPVAPARPSIGECHPTDRNHHA